MTATWDCPQARVALGGYVLGALDSGERALVDAHLATCDACQGELAELAALPALLALVPAEEAIALAEGLPGDAVLPDALLSAALLTDGRLLADGLPTDGRLLADGLPTDGRLLADGLPTDGRLLADDLAALTPPAILPLGGPASPLATVHDLSAARRRRQRLARAGAVAAAAVVIGGASFGGVKLAAGPSPAPSQASSADPHPNGHPNGAWATARGGNGQATVTVAYRSMGWGIQMDALVTGVPVHTRCQMWIVEDNGTRVQVGGWDTDAAEGTAWYPASAAVPATDVRAFVITVAGGRDITAAPA